MVILMFVPVWSCQFIMSCYFSGYDYGYALRQCSPGLATYLHIVSYIKQLSLPRYVHKNYVSYRFVTQSSKDLTNPSIHAVPCTPIKCHYHHF